MDDPSLRRLGQDDVRDAVAQAVSAYLGRPWQATRVESRHHQASHPAAVFSDGAFSDGAFNVFVKLNQGGPAADQLDQEVAGLRLLRERAGVPTPTVIATAPVADGMLVIMEAVQEVPRDAGQWRAYGRELARIHTAKGPRFGLERHSYWGSLYQDNRPLDQWPAFFWARRLQPRLEAAIASGRLPGALADRVAALEPRLPELCGPPPAPALLHGDAHQNNVLSTPSGPLFIDPAVYYGHPEMDLAFVDFFAPVAPELFQGYGEILPVDPGFAGRRDLWRIPAWLAMVEVDDSRHVETLRAIVQRYV